MERAIEGTKEFIKSRLLGNLRNAEVTSFSRFSTSFLFSNESSVDYMKQLDITGKEILMSVLASGDQIFNFIARGITEIDSFDVNELAEYSTLGIKRALVSKYDYKAYLEVVKKLWHPKTTSEEINEIFISLFPYMDKKFRDFWRVIVDYHHKLEKNAPEELKQNIIKTLFFSFSYSDLTCINYMSNEEEYNKLRANINNANINFKQGNIITKNPYNNRKYDLVYLSNILDYAFNSWGDTWDYGKLREFENRLFSIANKDALIILHYLFNTNLRLAILNSEVHKSDLSNEKIIEFDATPIRALGNIKDGLILIRKE